MLESSRKDPGLWVETEIMEVNTPIALDCYERALPLPTSSPLIYNQLSKLTYLPEAREAHETGLGAVQNVPIFKNLLQDRFFLSVWISSQHWHWLTARLYGAQCASVLAAWAYRRCLRPLECTHTHLYTCWYFSAHTHAQTKGRKKGTKEKWNDLHTF